MANRILLACGWATVAVAAVVMLSVVAFVASTMWGHIEPTASQAVAAVCVSFCGGMLWACGGMFIAMGCEE
jgi:hypothetical protein